MLKVVEIFSSVQGEGSLAGTPSVFLRLGRCNLHCPECDTKFDVFKEKEVSTVANDLVRRGTRYLVVTGGEPMLWQIPVSQLIVALGTVVHVTVETNGAVPICKDVRQLVDLFSFSPKVGSLGRNQQWKWDVAIKNVAIMRNLQAQVKYVVDPDIPADMETVSRFHSALLAEAVLLRDESIFFQPLDRGTEINVWQRRVPFDIGRYLADLVNLRKLVDSFFGPRYRVVPQLHKLMIFGGEGLREEILSAARAAGVPGHSHVPAPSGVGV